jgi:hypothetical protein
MTILANRNDFTQRAAHRIVTADAAQSTPVDWPVSGDETIRQYGRDGRRDMRPLWSAPGVKPESATEGIRVGSQIVTYDGTGTVTRVGSIAGFYMLNGTEQRWEIERVIEILL